MLCDPAKSQASGDACSAGSQLGERSGSPLEHQRSIQCLRVNTTYRPTVLPSPVTLGVPGDTTHVQASVHTLVPWPAGRYFHICHTPPPPEHPAYPHMLTYAHAPKRTRPHTHSPPNTTRSPRLPDTHPCHPWCHFWSPGPCHPPDPHHAVGGEAAGRVRQQPHAL